MIKKPIYAFARLLVRPATCAALLCTLIFNLRLIRNADYILFFPYGGFGHTLSGPDWLRRLAPNGRNLTIFGRWPGRHNAMIAELWGSERFLWVWSAIWLPRLGVVADTEWSERLFLFAEKQLRRIWPKKQYLQAVSSLVAATPPPAWEEPGGVDANRYESRLGALRLARPAPALHLGAGRLHAVEAALTRTVGKGYRRRCNLYLRQRPGDMTNIVRCSQSVAAFMPVIQYLENEGFLVMITGDVDIKNTAVDNEPLVVDWRRVGIHRDLFNVYCGTETDLHIGNLSGGSAYTYVADIQTILIDAMTIGDAYPKATIQYKRLADGDGRLIPLPTLFEEYSYDFECRGCRIIDASPAEILEVVKDVVENGLGVIPYGIVPESIGLNAPIMKSADARLSPVWVKGFSDRRYATSREPSAVSV
jgi:putative glycosyltransferase (TIGR04372 family)